MKAENKINDSAAMTTAENEVCIGWLHANYYLVGKEWNFGSRGSESLVGGADWRVYWVRIVGETLDTIKVWNLTLKMKRLGTSSTTCFVFCVCNNIFLHNIQN